MRDRFIYGANQFNGNLNQSNLLNYIGGNATHAHSIDIPEQDSISTSSNGSHSHTKACISSTKVDDNSDSHNHHYYYGSTGVSNGAISTSSAGAHYHTVNVASQTVQSSDGSSLPPYYALYFIMKCMQVKGGLCEANLQCFKKRLGSGFTLLRTKCPDPLQSRLGIQTVQRNKTKSPDRKRSGDFPFLWFESESN